MRWFFIVYSVLFVLFYFLSNAHAKSTRTILLGESETVTIHTALGYSTMLQFDAKPTAAVLGDQDAFKLEYVGTSLTIKPLMPSAKSNLFVFTDYDRYSFQLVNGQVASADFMVQVKRKGTKQIAASDLEPSQNETAQASEPQVISDEVNHPIHKSAVCGSITLSVDSISWPESRKWTLIHFQVKRSPKIKGEYKFEPGDVEVFQNKKSLPIDNLYLTNLALTQAQATVQGIAMIGSEHLSRKPVMIRFAPDFMKGSHSKCKAAVITLTGDQVHTASKK